METYDAGDRDAALRKIDAPALGVVIGAAIGGVLCVMSVAAYLFSLLGVPLVRGGDDRAFVFLSGVWGVLWSVFGLALSGFVLWAGLKMRALESYPLAVAACVISLIPCMTPCCVISLPFGIWGLIVMHSPTVRPHFRA